MNYYLHNPNCSKSRQGIEFIKENYKENFDQNVQVINYLEGDLNRINFEELFKRLKEKYNLESIIRIKQQEFINLNKSIQEITLKDIIDNPIILERPIIFNKKEVLIARPPELILEFI